jgi:hypothetical protein
MTFSCLGEYSIAAGVHSLILRRSDPVVELRLPSGQTETVDKNSQIWLYLKTLSSMPKYRITAHEAASSIAGAVLTFSAQATQQLGELLLPRASFLKRTFFSQVRNDERLEILKLNCDIVIPHVVVAEYNLEHGDYWDRDNSDIASVVRQLSFQAISEAFEKAGCAAIDANIFVRDKAERFAIHASTTRLMNIAEELERDHQLPSKMKAEDLVRLLGPVRISNYKKLWAEDQERSLNLEPPSIGDLLAEIYQHWRGEAQPSRAWNTLQFNLILEGSLLGLNLVTTKSCYEFDIS